MVKAGGNTVMASRAWAGGELIVASDSTWATNESLQRLRPAAWLHSLYQGMEGAVMEESQHGLVEGVGMLDLAKRYGLMGFFWALFIVLGLLLWSNLGFQVRQQEDLLDDEDSDAQSDGITPLLQRSIPPKKVLERLRQAHLERMPDDAEILSPQPDLKKPWHIYNHWKKKLEEAKYE